ncbi:restriction endonuclease [Vibrio sp. M260112]|uniref:restriction endonuclease n=1 Tax=Vibrio sp. M260112 TaxID=3020895 RepID=UPI002F424CEC
MTILDFNEIQRANIKSNKSDEFENFASEFFQLLGLKIEHHPGIGPDGGKDMIVKEILDGQITKSRKRWLISCKHKSHSGTAVGSSDEIDIITRVKRFQCTGFIGFYSTSPSQTLVDTFKDINREIECIFYNYSMIERELAKTDAGRDLAHRYFPQSSKLLNTYRPTTAPSNIVQLKCELCDKNIFDNLSTASVNAWGFDTNTGSSTTTYFSFHCSKRCEEQGNIDVYEAAFDEEWGYIEYDLQELVAYNGWLDFTNAFSEHGSLGKCSTILTRNKIDTFIDSLNKYIFNSRL